MARTRTPRRDQDRGTIDKLPSGALRVRVFAGRDPITKRRHDLTKVLPADTPNIENEAQRVRNGFLIEVGERRNPKAKATISQLLHRYLGQFDGPPMRLTQAQAIRRDDRPTHKCYRAPTSEPVGGDGSRSARYRKPNPQLRRRPSHSRLPWSRPPDRHRSTA